MRSGTVEAVAAAHDRVPLPREILVVREVERLLVPGDVEDVAVALGRQHPHPGAVVLDDDVGRDRRPVKDLVEVGGSDAGLGRDLADALDGALRRVVGRGRQLVDEDGARLVVDGDEIRERAADVDAYTLHRRLSFITASG